MKKRPSLSGNLTANMKALEEDTSPKPEVFAVGENSGAAKVTAVSRVGMKKLLTPVEPALHMRLKILAARRSTTLEALTREALQQYLADHDKLT